MNVQEILKTDGLYLQVGPDTELCCPDGDPAIVCNGKLHCFDGDMTPISTFNQRVVDVVKQGILADVSALWLEVEGVEFEWVGTLDSL